MAWLVGNSVRGSRVDVTKTIDLAFTGTDWSSGTRGIWTGPGGTAAEFDLHPADDGRIGAILLSLKGAGNPTHSADKAIKLVTTALTKLRASHDWYAFDLSDNSLVE